MISKKFLVHLNALTWGHFPLSRSFLYPVLSFLKKNVEVKLAIEGTEGGGGGGGE